MSSTISHDTEPNNKYLKQYNIPQDTGYAWVICISSFVIVFILIGSIRSFGIMYNEIMSYFGGSEDVGSLIFSFQSFLTYGLAPAIVAVAECTSCRIVILFGAGLLTVGYFLSWIATSLVHYIFTIGILTGIAASCIITLVPILIARYFCKRRLLAQGISLSGTGIGSFSFPFIIDVILEHFHLTQAFLIMGCIVAQIAVAGALLRPTKFYLKYQTKVVGTQIRSTEEVSDLSLDLVKLRLASATTGIQHLHDPETEKTQTSSRLDKSSGENSKKFDMQTSFPIDGAWPIPNKYSTSSIALHAIQSSRALSQESININQTIKTNKNVIKEALRKVWFYRSSDTKQEHPIINFHLLKRKRLLFFIFAHALFMTWVHLGVSISTRATELGIPRDKVAVLLSVIGVADTIGKLGAGIIGDTRYIKRYRLQFCIIVFFSASLSLFLLSFAETFWFFVVGTSISTLFLGVFSPTAPVIVSDLLGLHLLGEAWGLTLFISAFAVAIAGLTIGILRKITGSYRYSLLFHSALTAAASVCLVLCLLRVQAKKRKKIRNQRTKSKVA